MNIHLHQTHHTLADFPAIFLELKNSMRTPGLHLFPELFLTGYPLADLCLTKSFITHYQEHRQRLDEWLTAQNEAPENCALLGGLDYSLNDAGVPTTIRNVIFECRLGLPLKVIYTKRLLPNYDIFDEQKYFSAGLTPGVWQWQGKNFALMICEDMWASSFHKLDPAQDLLPLGPFDGIFNLSASPFEVGKQGKRQQRATHLSQLLQAPFFYVNRVGGEDEILFDGQSFVINGDQLMGQTSAFEGALLSLELPAKLTYAKPTASPSENTWESLFAPQLMHKSTGTELLSWSDDDCALVSQALQFGLQEYASKNGFRRFLIALSGGMDSALVLTLVKLSLKPDQEVAAIYMPGNYSSPLSWDLAALLCQNLNVPLTSLPIKFLHSNIRIAFQSTYPDPFQGLTDENVQSRLRGLLLYTRSNQTGAMVLNTSNKSELAVGYSTQYGDSVGALSILGDLYKTEVYRLAEWLNSTHGGELIPSGILNRPPSAELRPGQKDQDSLPPYSRLDAILEGILSYRHDQRELVKMGLPEDEVSLVFQLYAKTEYKRRQFCPIIKIKAKSFGFGYRVPLTKHVGFYRPSSQGD